MHSQKQNETGQPTLTYKSFKRHRIVTFFVKNYSDIPTKSLSLNVLQVLNSNQTAEKLYPLLNMYVEL